MKGCVKDTLISNLLELLVSPIEQPCRDGRRLIATREIDDSSTNSLFYISEAQYPLQFQSRAAPTAAPRCSLRFITSSVDGIRSDGDAITFGNRNPPEMHENTSSCCWIGSEDDGMAAAKKFPAEVRGTMTGDMISRPRPR